MAPTGTKRIVWKHGEDDFCLAKCEDIWALEALCYNSGIAEIMNRLETGRWRLNDVRETIRIGLIGGGMEAKDAMEVIKVFVVPPYAIHVMLAYEILAAALVGVPDDEIKKNETGQVGDTASSTKTEDSADPRSSPLEQVSRGETREQSDNAPSGNSQPPLKATTEPMGLTTAPSL